MRLSQNERTVVIIDGVNLYSAARNLGFDVDYRQLLQYFETRCNLLRAYYYSTILESEDNTFTPLKPLTAWLSYNGYTVVSKPAKEIIDSSGRRRVRGNMDIELACDMLEVAPRVDHVVLFSGDNDFRRVVETVQRRGVRVTVVSSLKASPPVIGDELRRQADTFEDLADIGLEFTRKSTDRPSREAVDKLVAKPLT